MTSEEAVKIMSILTAAYPQANLEDYTIKLYIRFLQDVPFEAGMAASLQLIAESKWFPAIAELRQAAISLLPGNELPSPAEAWGEVQQQIRHVGYIGTPTFSHPAIAAAVKAMGWLNICKSEEGMVDRAHFLKIYESYRQRELHEQLQPPEAKRLMEQLIQRTAIEEPVKEQGKLISMADLLRKDA